MPPNLDHLRERLATMDAVALLSLLGALAGLVSALVILLFRLLVEGVLDRTLGGPEYFESLPVWLQGILPLAGVIVLVLGFRWLKPEQRRTGISHVIERFHLYQGMLGLRGLLVQFAGGAITLLFGLSMGREGPAVHLGSASGSLLGQWAKLPNNSVRALTGCGCAAAIAASFNTPIAGVVFAMEVVMMEYHIATFIPIILAAVVGASLSRAVYGDEIAFVVPPVNLQSLLELPFVMAGSLLIGCMASALIFLSRSAMTRTAHWHFGWRYLLAGLITSLCAMLAPEIMGVGYDTVEAAIAGQLGVTALLIILVLKLIATSACVGAGLPGGVIGPMLLLGAMVGGLIGTLGSTLMPASNGSLYVLLGMAAMMSATLQAPLAGLMALLELTANPNIIFPGMLAVVTACLVTSQIFHQKGIYLALLSAQGIQLRVTPLSHQLQRVGVAAVMHRNVARAARHITLTDLRNILAQKPQWLLIEQDAVPHHYMPASDVALYLTSLDDPSTTVDTLDLLEIPGTCDNINPIPLSATLKEALNQMKQQQVSALYVHSQSTPGVFRIQGLLRQDDIEHYYQP